MVLPLSLKPECVDIDIDGDDKYSVIKMIIEKLSKACDINHKVSKELLKDMISREQLMSTGMQSGIALPHCSSENVDRPYVFLAKSKKGVDFGSTDGSIAKIIVALVIPKDKISHHVKTMAAIARLLNEEKIRMEILESDSEQKIVDIFNRININE